MKVVIFHKINQLTYLVLKLAQRTIQVTYKKSMKKYKKENNNKDSLLKCHGTIIQSLIIKYSFFIINIEKLLIITCITTFVKRKAIIRSSESA
jgi:hypothetical protein